MAIIKDVTVKINNGTATLDAPVQFYEKDHDVELRFKLMDYKYKYDKDPQNILNSVDEDVLEAYTTIVNPRGYELEQINGVIKNDTVIFRLDPTYTDELDELGTYKLQIHIKCTHSEFTIPPITFEVLQRLKGIKVVTDGEDEVDNSEILDNSSKFVSDETGKLIIEWKKGDMISSAKLNAMVDVINDAVDEEVIRQANEKERERKAANKIQELENTRVEYVNKFDTELDSFNDQVDESMLNYETRFNALTVSQQQDAEVIDARDGEQTLRARLERDIQKPSIIYEEVEGSHINADTTCGYLKDIEILGNTIQNQNDLADIRSVGDKVEGQELYEIPVLCTNGLDSSDSNYKEHKLTILSPVQLEKVGDVADRIVCKDGVWGVEKNIETLYLGEDILIDSASNINDDNYYGCYTTKTNLTEQSIDNIIVNMPKINWTTGFRENPSMTYWRNGKSSAGVVLPKNILSSYNINTFNLKLVELGIFIKCQTTQPQFIPLPYDQQVKLCTFVNKTNISFGCEIEPTLKASVPKSIGASISSNTTQIDNLSKELEKINNLEESVTSEVVSESDFITVENTNSGYFSDIKLEGKTLILNADNEVVEAGTEGATLKSVGQDVDEISVLTQNKEETKENEKRILYYNDETQTWEKPILKEWDSIEKHADGKYYYHQRSGEVVLNGSENWHRGSNNDSKTITSYFGCNIPNIVNNNYVCCDNFPRIDLDVSLSRYELEGARNSSGNIYININKARLSEDSLVGFKAWIQANPTTVVYQLAEEKVYECTDLDLITYSGETNLLVKSGVLNPKVTLKVKKGIGNVVTMLQNKVTMLEQMVYDLMKMFNNQQSNIDE